VADFDRRAISCNEGAITVPLKRKAGLTTEPGFLHGNRIGPAMENGK
jgi:hypothetical protein